MVAKRKKPEPKKLKPKSKGGLPPHQPTLATMAKVEALAGFGAPAEHIAKEIGVGEKTLRKHYRRELDSGIQKANVAVVQSLYKKAIGNGPGAVVAAIFWTKTRLGWREPPQEHQVSGKDGGKVEVEQSGIIKVVISADDAKL